MTSPSSASESTRWSRNSGAKRRSGATHALTQHRQQRGVEEGLLPHYRHAGLDDMEEERRLFYVGLTRAKTRLLLTVCRERMLWGRPWAFGPSPFLAEAGLV